MTEKTSMATPFFMRFLGNQLKDWVVQGDAVIAHPKAMADFSELVILPRRIMITGEDVWRFSFFVPLITPEQMKSEHKQAYQRFKNMECQLSWEGFPRRRPVFKVHATLEFLSKHISSIQKDNRVVAALNSNSKVLDLVKMVRPDDMTVSLYSLHAPAENTDEFVKSVRKSYENPDRIVWIIMIEKNFHPVFGNKRYRAIVDGIYSVGNQTAGVVRKVSDVALRFGF